jgi:hypothetical protein
LSRLARVLVPAVAAACAAGPLAAQTRLGAWGIGLAVQHRVDAGNGLELSSGALYGAALSMSLNPRLEIGIEGVTGNLTRDSGQAENATLARAEGHVAVQAMPWLALRTGLGIHTFKTPIAVQRWTSVRVGAEGRLDFVGGALSGIVRFELYPIVDVTGLGKPNRAFGAASGLRFNAGVVSGDVLYTFERYDFPEAGGVARVEQLSALRVSLGVRLGR